MASKILTVLLISAVIGYGATELNTGPKSSDKVSEGPKDSDTVPDNGSVNESVSTEADLKVLFVGNSYTSSNNLPGIYSSLIENDPRYRGKKIRVESVTEGGYRLIEHANDLNRSTKISRLMNESNEWDYIVLQEQSQAPGFSMNDPEKQNSLKGVQILSQRAEKNNATVVLMMTWGRRKGDTKNSHIYPNFTRMQGFLDWGYHQLQRRALRYNPEVKIAPAGKAFHRIYNYSEKNEGEPTSRGTLFYQLYRADGSHPSNSGSYLAALTIKKATVGLENSSYVPQGLEQSKAEKLQKIGIEGLKIS